MAVDVSAGGTSVAESDSRDTIAAEDVCWLQGMASDQSSGPSDVMDATSDSEDDVGWSSSAGNNQGGDLATPGGVG